MIQITDINLKTTFREETKVGICQDLADYASLRTGGTSNLYGLISAVYANDGTLVKDQYTDPFIDIQGAETESDTFALPLNTGTGKILFGDYKFTYTVFKRYAISGIAMVSPGGTTINLIGDFTDRIEAGDTMTVTGSNNSGDGDYTVSTVVFGGGTTVVTLTTTMPSDNTWDAVFTWSVSRTYDYCLSTLGPDAKIQGKYSCDAATFTSEDITEYGDATLTSRTHKIQFPRKSDGTEVLNDITDTTLASNKVLVSSVLWTGSYTISVNTVGSLEQNDGLFIEFDITALTDIDVECNSQVVEARGCIAKLYDSYKTAAIQGIYPNPYQNVLTQINTAYLIHRLYGNVGDRNTSSTWAQEVIDLVNANGCNCSLNTITDEPVEVVPVTAIDTIFLGWQTPLTTAGDLYYRDSSNADARLPKGTQGRILGVPASGIPGYLKPESDVLDYSMGPETTGGMSWAIPKNYIDADGEGIVFEQVLRVTGGDTLSLQLNAESPLTYAFPGSTTYFVKAVMVKNGANFDVELLVHSSSTAPAKVANSFTANLAIINTLTLSHDQQVNVIGYDHKISYINNRTMI